MLLLLINEICDSVNKICIDLLLFSSGGGPAFGAVWPWQQGRPIRVAVAEAVAVAVGGLMPDDFAADAMVGIPEWAAGIFDGADFVVTAVDTAVASALVDIVDAGEKVSVFWTDSSVSNGLTTGSLILNHTFYS